MKHALNRALNQAFRRAFKRAFKHALERALKRGLIVLAVVFLLLQFTNPARTNPPVKKDLIATLNPPPAVAAGLRAACYDCHSHETTWPVYAKIAPSSWLVVSDVNEGRKHLNLSDWPDDSVRAAKKLDRISEVLEYQEMPPKKYTLMHPDARLSDDLRKQIKDWADATETKLQGSATNQ